jgi:hypothetical protein
VKTVWPVRRLDSFAEVRLGRQRSPDHHEGADMRPYVRAANVGWDGLKLDDVKTMNFTDAEMSTYELKAGRPLAWRGIGKPERGRQARLVVGRDRRLRVPEHTAASSRFGTGAPVPPALLQGCRGVRRFREAIARRRHQSPWARGARQLGSAVAADRRAAADRSDLGQGRRASSQTPSRPRPPRLPHPINLPRNVRWTRPALATQDAGSTRR